MTTDAKKGTRLLCAFCGHKWWRKLSSLKGGIFATINVRCPRCKESDCDLA